MLRVPAFMGMRQDDHVLEHVPQSQTLSQNQKQAPKKTGRE